MAAHETFEQLCALAVTGEITGEEFRRLQDHLHECPSCRGYYRDFHALLNEGLPAVAEPPKNGWKPGAFGLKKRFAERARKEGIPISEPASLAWRVRWMPAAAAVAGLALLAWPVYRLQVRRAEADETAALLSRRIAQLEHAVSARRETAPAPAPLVTPPTVPTHRERELADRLAALRADYDLALAEKAKLGEQASRLSAQLDQARLESRTAKAEAENLARTLQDTRTTLARANQDLDSIRGARSRDEAAIAEQRLRLDQLAAKVRDQAEILDRERELLAAAHDIRDLMGARNMKVAEVADVGGPRRRGIPGRVFYSKEKLIYYAFDLENRGDIRKVAFQVWGKREGRSQPPRSLGLLSLDNAAEQRWVLRNEDANLLAHIDHVFVTVEPPGGSPQPTSRQILFATLLQP